MTKLIQVNSNLSRRRRLRLLELDEWLREESDVVIEKQAIGRSCRSDGRACGRLASCLEDKGN